ncbi:unnamed protein product, partial [Mycena citricolor]
KLRWEPQEARGTDGRRKAHNVTPFVRTKHTQYPHINTVVLNNSCWKARIRGYSAAMRLSKNLDAVHTDFLANLE